MDNVLKFIDSLSISFKEYIIVATSGGPDSMVLLSILNNKGYKCVCAHVNHNVRCESKKEYEYLEEYCKQNKIIFEGMEIQSYKNNRFSEEEARKKRYDFFEMMTIKYHSRYVFTAHHGDDLMETILMRIVRGSSLKGYQGFLTNTSKDNYNIVRPLVYLNKDEIVEYANKNKIKYFVDKTNLEDDHTRNRFRHYILPPLKEEDKDVHLKFIKFRDKLNENIEYLNRVVDSYEGKVYTENEIIISKFVKLDQYIQKLIVEKIFRMHYLDNLYLISDIHTNMIINLIDSKSNCDINLPGGLIARKEYNKILFLENNIIESFNYKLENKQETALFNIYLVDECDDNSNYTIRLNSSDIKLPIIIRNRNIGDKIYVKNMNGSKKVNDIFIDNKISKEKRDKWPIIVDSDNNVLLVPGLKKSKFDIEKNLSYDIIVRCETREDFK